MPEEVPAYLISVSDECESFPASNLIDPNNSMGKWQVSENHCKPCSIEFKFEKSFKFHRIDIGNNGTALFEVHVKKSADSAEDPENSFKCLIPATSLLSPDESNKERNLNKVKIFTQESFNKTVSNHEYNVVKIICSQPFSRHLKFGLSFIKFYSKSELPPVETPKAVEDKPKTLPVLPEQSQKLIETMKAKIKESNNNRAVEKVTTLSSSSQDNRSKRLLDTSAISYGSPKPKKRNIETDQKPLEGVLFSLSGYQNPMRSQLREMALQLGAKYSNNWTDQCTHLVCAFKNTPKFTEAVGKSIIVSDKWIKDSFRSKKMESWRNYRVGRAASPLDSRFQRFNPIIESGSDSEDNLDDDRDSNYQPVNSSSSSNHEESSPSPSRSDEENQNPYDVDTDEEVEIKQKKASKPKTDKPKKVKETKPIFNNLKFYLHKTLVIGDERKEIITRILQHSGQFSPEISENMNYFVASGPWDEEFQAAIEVKSDIIFIPPKWIYDSIATGKLIASLEDYSCF